MTRALDSWISGLFIALSALLVFISSVAVPVSWAVPPPPEGPVPGSRILVDAYDQGTQALLAAHGATRLVDYGAFSLWSVPNVREQGRYRTLAGDGGDFYIIRLRGGMVIDTRLDGPDIAPDLTIDETVGSQFWMVQFIGPIKDEWLAELRGLRLLTVTYMPNYAYVVWGDGNSLDALRRQEAKSAVIQWTGPYHPAYRLSPALHDQAVDAPSGQSVDVTVQLFNTPGLNESLRRLRSLSSSVLYGPVSLLNLTDIALRLPAARLVEVARWPDVFNVEPFAPPIKLDEVQNQILAGNVTMSGPNVVPSGPGYLDWLGSKGFSTDPSSYPIVDIVDDGVDIGDAGNVLHPDFHVLGLSDNPDRVSYIGNCTSDDAGNGVAGHGNINAGIVGSYNDRSGSPHVDGGGYRIGLGMSPYGRIAGTKIFNNAGDFDLSACGWSYQGIVNVSYNGGALVTSNSWGYPYAFGSYDSASRSYDILTRDASKSTAGNQEMLHVFAAGNTGPSEGTLNSPGTAKNVLTVGATENVRDNGTADGCGHTASNNADDVIGFSSRGPTDDGRIKPDIMAPGVHVQGPASQDPCFDGSAVCGRSGNDFLPPPDDAYYPAGQTLYTWSSGTSDAAPAMAGVEWLVPEYYGRVLAPGSAPSPAMTKALLVSTARYLTGTGANDTLPSPNQGWGDADLGMLFDDVAYSLIDQTVLMQSSGEEYVFLGSISDVDRPFRVSLVWTDAPGSTTGAAYVNDLDLEVTIGDSVYKGNVFDGRHSTVGGAFDPRNNVENVFLPAGFGGSFRARVIARNIAGDGVPGNGDSTDQDFALVLYNAQPHLLEAVDVRWAEVEGDFDGFVEPGETISVDIDLHNIGTEPATAVSGVLQPLGEVGAYSHAVQSSSTYPDIGVGETKTNDSSYLVRVTSAHPCGEELRLRQTVSYQERPDFAHTFDIPTGTPVEGGTTYLCDPLPTDLASPLVMRESGF